MMPVALIWVCSVCWFLSYCQPVLAECRMANGLMAHEEMRRLGFTTEVDAMVQDFNQKLESLRDKK